MALSPYLSAACQSCQFPFCHFQLWREILIIGLHQQWIRFVFTAAENLREDGMELILRDQSEIMHFVLKLIIFCAINGKYCIFIAGLILFQFILFLIEVKACQIYICSKYKSSIEAKSQHSTLNLVPTALRGKYCFHRLREFSIQFGTSTIQCTKQSELF